MRGADLCTVYPQLCKSTDAAHRSICYTGVSSQRQYGATVLLTRVANQPTLSVSGFAVRMLTRVALLNYCTVHKSCISTNAACRSIGKTYAGPFIDQSHWPTLCICQCDGPMRRERATCVLWRACTHTLKQKPWLIRALGTARLRQLAL